ncbi:MAG: butyrate kinase [candidate division WOR-3 bacterium]
MLAKILVINPGGGSTKIGIFEDRKLVLEKNINHSPKELNRFKSILDQYHFRYRLILKFLERNKFNLSELAAIATRGGPLKPLKAGTYRITERVITDIKDGKVQSYHPSLLGPLIAKELANRLNIPSYFVDPESVDEFSELARISGLPEITRKALAHTTSVKMVIRKTAERLNKPVQQCNFVVAHLGSGITVAAVKKGRIVDSNNANEDGPYSSQRSGSLPLPPLVEMCFSGKYTKDEIIDKIQRKGGLLAYLGTDKIPEIENRIKEGNKRAKLIYEAMIYQIAKEIGSYAVVLKGKLDAIILTGGMAISKELVKKLKSYIKFLCPKIFVFPGEVEMEALALGAQRVLCGEEKEKIYA